METIWVRIGYLLEMGEGVDGGWLIVFLLFCKLREEGRG